MALYFQKKKKTKNKQLWISLAFTENKPFASNGHTTKTRAGSKIICETLMPGYAMLMSPNKDKTAVHGCHCLDNMALRMR